MEDTWWYRNRAKLGGIGAAVGGLTAVAILIATLGGGPSESPGKIYSLDIQASRDIGRLPSRDSWCSLARQSEHCYLLQQSSGDATDYGSPGGWHLTPSGSPRAGVVTGLPVAAVGGVDFTSEKATWVDQGSGVYLADTSVTSSATTVSATVVFNSTRGANPGGIFAFYGGGPYWMGYFNPTNGRIYLAAYGTAGRTVYGTTSWDDGAWHCATFVMTQAVGGTKIFVDGAEDAVIGDLDTGGSWAGTGYFRLMATANTANTLMGGEARARLDFGVTHTLDQHQRLCGTYALPLRDGHRAYSDTTYTQTGAEQCYPSGPNTAMCWSGGTAAYAYRASDQTYHYAVEGQAQVNRILFNMAIDPTNWTCTGSATAIGGQIAPDGSATASQIITSGTDGVWSPSVAGYTDGEPLYPRLWLKCDTGEARLINGTAANGDWRVACATASAGSWVLIYGASQAGVTEIAAWTARTGANDYFVFYGGTATNLYGWAPTITEEQHLGEMASVIPTEAAAADTGDIAWQVDNSIWRYWRYGARVIEELVTIDATCLQLGTTIDLAGPSETPCIGAWKRIRVEP